jgi:hypothetical protein
MHLSFRDGAWMPPPYLASSMCTLTPSALHSSPSLILHMFSRAQGHVEAGEDFLQTALRELAEESGLATPVMVSCTALLLCRL